jgi:hypothetical protein
LDLANQRQQATQFLGLLADAEPRVTVAAKAMVERRER